MPAAFTTLKLRTLDGTTLVADFMPAASATAGTPLQAGGWAPQVADEADNPLGSRSGWQDVTEEITFDVFGATALQLIANIKELLRRARNYWRKGTGQAVVLEVQIINSNLTSTLVALVKDGKLITPASYNDLSMVNDFAGLTLRVVRSGLWTTTTGTAASSATSANAPGPITITMPSAAPQPSPTVLELTGFNTATATTLATAVTLVAPSGLLTMQAASSLAPNGAFTSVVETAGNQPVNTNVLRFTPTSTALASTGFAVVTGLTGSARTFAIYATMRASSAVTYTVIPFLIKALTAGSGTVAPGTPVTFSGTAPTLVALGRITFPDPVSQPTLALQASASATGGTLDIDAIWIMAVDDERSTDIVTQGIGTVTLTTLFGASAQERVMFQHDPLNYRVPVKIGASTSTTAYMSLSYTGNAAILTQDTGIMVAFVGTQTTFWRQTGVTLSAAATRYTAYMVPQ